MCAVWVYTGPQQCRASKNHALNEPREFKFEPLGLVMSSTHAEVRYKNRLRYSRPCSNCIVFMRFCGVKDVVYSTGDSDVPYIIERVSQMPLLGKSRGDRG
jgi:hypothetical protein